MIVLVILVIFIIIPAVIFWFDKFSDFYEGLKRYHIGQWSNVSAWEEALVKKAIIWSKYPPNVSVKEISCYKLIDYFRKKQRCSFVQSWQEGMLALGLMEYGQKKEIKFNRTKFIDKYISIDGNWKQDINRIDFALLAYTLLKLSDNPLQIAPAMNRMIEVIENNLCVDGMISYSQGKKTSLRYVDTLGMICPFLSLYGKTYNKEEYISLSIKQIEKFTSFGLLAKYRLPCHAYDVQKLIPVGIYGWGRGTAWYFLSLIDTWNELEVPVEKNKIMMLIIKAADAYKEFQSADGGFSTILQGGGQYDSSVTAAMAYFYSFCAREIDKNKYINIASKCFCKLKSVTMQSGAIDCCQGDTHGIGIFSQLFDVMPFAQGLALRGLAVMEDEINE